MQSELDKLYEQSDKNSFGENVVYDSIERYGSIRPFTSVGEIVQIGFRKSELVTNTKKSLISDDISLAKVISYCTSRGIIAAKIVVKTRIVNQKTLGKFIDVDEAYQRIKTFAGTSQFFSFPKDDRMNAVAFILVTERTPSRTAMKDHISEDAIEKALKQLGEKPANE